MGVCLQQVDFRLHKQGGDGGEGGVGGEIGEVGKGGEGEECGEGEARGEGDGGRAQSAGAKPPQAIRRAP